MKTQLNYLLLVSLLVISCRKGDKNGPSNVPNQTKHFTTKNSPLPDNQVNAISVAGATVWVGTQNGLAQLSSGNWQVFTTANSRLPSPIILSVAAVADDCVWIGTDKGLLHYCQAKWTEYTMSNSLLKNNVIKEIAIDHQRSIVWVGTEGGLLRLSGNDQEWVDDTNSNLIDNHITALVITSSGSLLVGTFDHFQFQGSCWQYKDKQWTRLLLNNIGYPSSFVNSLFVREDRAWMAIGGTSGGAVVGLENQQPVIHYNRQNSPMMAGVLAVGEDEKDLWMATGAGLYRKANSGWNHFTARNGELPANHLLCMQVVSGTLYLGTLQNGLVVWQP